MRPPLGQEALASEDLWIPQPPPAGAARSIKGVGGKGLGHLFGMEESRWEYECSERRSDIRPFVQNMGDKRAWGTPIPLIFYASTVAAICPILYVDE